jgi:hypothetical protein
MENPPKPNGELKAAEQRHQNKQATLVTSVKWES